MTMRVSVNFHDASEVSVADRGLTYGDGLFETLRMVRGRAPLWPRHAARLRESCQRLGLPPPDSDAILAEAARLCAGTPDAVVRVTYTRGPGARGYAPPESPCPTLVVTAAPLTLDGAAFEHGVAVRLCATRLALQPALAGMKHLNRLEQVLAGAEWSGTAWAEGLLQDMDGHVACATAANVFAVIDGETRTPPVDRCGVAGVARAEILATHAARVAPMTLAELHDASEVFLTSAVRGILPVRALDSHDWQPGPVARALQAHWHGLGLPLP